MSPLGFVQELALWALRRRRRWRIQGSSMAPDYLDQDLVLVDPAVRVLVPGAVAIAKHPFKNLDVVKYVDAVSEDGYVTLRSPAGDDSRQFGRVTQRSVRGVVTTNLSAARRR